MQRILLTLSLAPAALAATCGTDADCQAGGDAAAYCKENGACRCSDWHGFPAHGDTSTCLRQIWRFCDGAAPAGPAIKNVETFVTPRVPDKNSTDIKVELFAQIAETVNGGTIKYNIDFDGVTFKSATDPICDFTKCPVKPGPVDASVDFAQFMPIVHALDSGNYTGRASFRDAAGNENVCLELSWQI